MAPRRRGGPGRLLALGFVAIVLALGGLAAWCFVDAQRYPVADLATKVPKRTVMMEQRIAQAAAKGRTLRIAQRWAPYGAVSPLLRHAVLVAEDDAFFQHGGLDWNEINASVRRDLEQRRAARGGSTITQQLAKNLFLGDRKTITRKLTEAFLAMRLEQALTKRRIFELYLNEIEWGDGVFGAEAAARHYWGVSASSLSPRQAVLLAAVIINPRRFSVDAPNRRIQRRVRIIASRLRRRGVLDATQYAMAIGAPPPVLADIPHPPGVPVPAVMNTTTAAADSSLKEPDLERDAPPGEAPPPAPPDTAGATAP